MALIKFGGGVAQMVGSIAGTTFARNRFGAYSRNRTKPVNPRTADQVTVRSAVSYLVERWSSGLTAAQRTAWNTYAAAISMKNKLGEVVNLTGFNHYVRSNTVLKYKALTIVDAGPTVLSLPEKDTTVAAAISVATQKASITFDNGLDWANEANGHLLIYQGVPQLATRNYFNGPFHYMGKVDGNATTPPTSPAAIDVKYTAVLGQKVWFKFRVVRADGRMSESFFCSCVVAA